MTNSEGAWLWYSSVKNRAKCPNCLWGLLCISAPAIELFYFGQAVQNMGPKKKKKKKAVGLFPNLLCVT